MAEPEPGAAQVGVVLRRAGAEDAVALADLERDANLVALRHVYDPARHAFPLDAVLARWRELLARPDVVVEVVDGPAGIDALLADDGARVRHLAVRPERWGGGLAGLLLDRAVDRITAGGGQPVLWCLADNHRARGLYEHRGWRPTGVERAAEHPPHPRELEHVLAPRRDDR